MIDSSQSCNYGWKIDDKKSLFKKLFDILSFIYTAQQSDTVDQTHAMAHKNNISFKLCD